MNRRTFLANSAITLAGASILGSSFAKALPKPIGLQLYTLRDVIGKDVKGTLKQLASWGYKEFETYGYTKGSLFGMTSKEFNAYVKSLGCQVTSGHYGIDVVRGEWDRAVADAKEAGQEYVVLPWIEEKDRTADGYKKIIDDVNKAAEVAKKSGLKMGYHNHDFEFKKVGDTTGYEMLLKGLDPKLVSMEIDLYWVVRAGYNPMDLFAKYPGRFHQWHVKDMDKNKNENNADVGTGAIDFKALFAQAEKAGLRHFYVEQETYPADPMTSTKNSITYLKTL